jgi:alkylation response protein AidB-like acyl-CoA dehydrogenase
VDFDLSQSQLDIRRAVAELCERFPSTYWRDLEPDGYPEAFVTALTEAGWLSVLIPEEYGGGGLGLVEGALVLEEINASGGNAAACHAQMYTMGAILRHGTDEQKRRYLPAIANGSIRLQAFGITEPDAGSDTLSIKTHARRDGDEFVLNGQKVFVSRALHSDMMLLLARTTPKSEVVKRTDGLSLFLIDLRNTPGIDIKPLTTMINHSTTEVFFDNARVPADSLVGEEGKGFRCVLDAMNAERVLIASECIGDGRWFVETGSAYASSRMVFDRPIGQNQGVQFPLAAAFAAVEAASLYRLRAAWLFDQGSDCGKEANVSKLLASQASWQAANACLDAHGGWGFTREFDVERKFRETRLYMTAPVSNNLVLSYLAQHALSMPRSF